LKPSGVEHDQEEEMRLTKLILGQQSTGGQSTVLRALALESSREVDFSMMDCYREAAAWENI
jgi:hypothetical protein